VIAGSFWTDLVPFFKSDAEQYLTMDQYSNPNRLYFKWDVCDNNNGLDAGITNDYYVNGLNCPWDIPDQWTYEYQGEWFVDPSLKIACSQWR